jgi:hypothetical protein
MSAAESWTRLLARVTAPLSFATKARVARRLFVFALAEQESMLELRAAAALSDSPARRALYLRHAKDEERHAAMFAAHSADLRRSLGKMPWGAPRATSENLFAKLGEAGFLAFVHAGEMKGRTQFTVYARHFEKRGEPKLRALFSTLVADEQGHEDYTLELLARTQDGGAPARRKLLGVRAWEALRAWRRAGQGLAGALYTVLMSVLYVTLLPLALWVRLTRPRERGWLPP